MTSSRSAQLQSLQALTEMQEFLDFISNEGSQPIDVLYVTSLPPCCNWAKEFGRYSLERSTDIAANFLVVLIPKDWVETLYTE